MNTTFIINGGAGRVITAEPALRKFHRLNPNDDFTVLIYGWESLFWSHPLLQQRTFSIGQKGVFEQYIKSNRVVSPEPYHIHGYYNQYLSLSEAFDQEINNTNSHDDLDSPRLYVSTSELNNIQWLLRQKMKEKNATKMIVIQPYGTGMSIKNERPYDDSHRSMDVDGYLYLVNKIYEMNRDVLIVYFGMKDFKHPGDNVSLVIEDPNADLRMYLTLISMCDYFVGCDSVGQHMARAMNKPGLIFMGSTNETNVSYPDHFTIYRKEGSQPTYSPIRLSGLDCEFADRMNDGIMNFSHTELDKAANIISRNLYE